MANFRKERIEEAIRQVVSYKTTIGKESLGLPPGLLTINKVDVAPDLSQAKVFFSFFSYGDNEFIADSLLQVINKVSPIFRFEVSKKLNLRKTPRIIFVFDKNTEHAFKIQKLLQI